MNAEESEIQKPDPKKRLGRGLDALFGDEEDGFAGPDSDTQTSAKAGRNTVGVDQLEPGSYQPRETMDDDSLRELADSIASHGVLQPILVRPKPGPDGSDQPLYEIIAGERRWRAAQLAQLHEVPVIVRELSNLEAMELGLIENLQREDLNTIEEAMGYARLIDQFGHTQEKVAKSLGKSRSHIANTLRLLTLPQPVQDYIREGVLTAGHARALVTSDDPEALAKQIIEDKLSVRDAEKFAKGAGDKKKSSSKKSSGKAASKDVDTLALEKEITGILGMNVEIDISVSDVTKGVLKVNFTNLDQLDEVLHRLSHYPGRQQSG